MENIFSAYVYPLLTYVALDLVVSHLCKSIIVYFVWSVKMQYYISFLLFSSFYSFENKHENSLLWTKELHKWLSSWKDESVWQRTTLERRESFSILQAPVMDLDERLLNLKC